MSQQPAGWYDDPETEDTLRYWDGVQWTHHTSPRHRPTAAPGAGAPGAGNPGGGQPAGGSGGGSPWTTPSATQGQGGYPSYPQQQASSAGGQPGYGGTWQQGGFSVPSTADGQPLASWLSRLGARLIDWVLVAIVSIVITLTVRSEDLNVLGSQSADFQQWLLDNQDAWVDGQFPPQFQELAERMLSVALFAVLVYAAVWVVYDVLFTAWRGATLGKMAVGIHVRPADGPGALNPVYVLLRSLAQFWLLFALVVPILSWVGILYFFLDQLWPLWDDKRQALHDKAGRTQVVKGPRRSQS